MAVKKQRSIALSDPQIAFLEEFSKRRGMSMGELVRWIIDSYRERIGELEKMGVKL